MCVLGWKDNDGNGIPDWLDEFLEDLGIPRIDPPEDDDETDPTDGGSVEPIGCGNRVPPSP